MYALIKKSIVIYRKKRYSKAMKRKNQTSHNVGKIHNESPLGKHSYAGKSSKVRADQLLFEQGLAESREQAKRFIMARQVFVGDPGVAVDKPGQAFAPDTVFKITGQERYASRGAYKLLTGLEYFSLDVTDFICLDAGASTGGFTDCLLQHGAAKVYAVDVGHGQLHEKLRQDARVINLEKTNLRVAEPSLIPEMVDMVVADVSFISLTMVLPSCMPWLKVGGKIMALIKPQFEVGVGQTDKGIVRDEAVRQGAIDKVVAFCQEELCLHFEGIVPSAILGPKGNQEYLALFTRQA